MLDPAPMPLELIHGPPNSGRAGLIRKRFSEARDREPVLVVPTLDDVFRLELELCEAEAVLGGAVMTFGGLFRTIAASGDAPPAPELSKAQRVRAIAVAVRERRRRLIQLSASAGRAGFAQALDRLLDELQAAGLDPEAVEAGAGTLESSAYLGDVASLFAGYTTVRDRLGRADQHTIARAAIELLQMSPAIWSRRAVLFYGFDDLTVNQLDLIEALAATATVTVSVPFEDGNPGLAGRASLLAALRGRCGSVEELRTEADPANTANPLLFALERGFAGPGAEARAPGEGLTLLRSAGERGEAEAIASAVARLLHDGAAPDQTAIVLRRPERRGRLLARVLESYGVPAALEAELPVSTTAVGGALLALLEAEHGTRRAADVLRWLRGPSGVKPVTIDWLERAIRRGRIQTAEEALAMFAGDGDLPYDLEKLRDAGQTGLTAELAETARRMGSRFPVGDHDGPPPGPGDGVELRAAATISGALTELTELPDLSPGPTELMALLTELTFRAWSGPVEGRVRIADPKLLRALRFDHVFIGSLQDGEFPSRGAADPFLSEEQRQVLGLDPRRDTEVEERYLFYSSLALPRRSLFLSYRDADQDGAALARSPFIDDVRRLLDPPPGGEEPDPVERAITRVRDLAQVVDGIGEAASENRLAKSVAARGVIGKAAADALDLGAPPPDLRTSIEARLASARQAEKSARAPGPIDHPDVVAELAAVPAYGGTTLELFDVCSYRWFVDHELGPQQLDPVPDPLLAGGLMHAVLDRLYREPPGDSPVPSPPTLAAWIARGMQLIAEEAEQREIGERPGERAVRRSTERLLARFLGEEADRGDTRFRPWLLEAKFGEGAGSARPALEIDGWRLHGAVDRVDRDPLGRVLVHDYKVSGRAAPGLKLEEEAKLQLQLYLMAVERLWSGTPGGALYHPLRATRSRSPRGLVLEEVADELPGFGLVGTDILEPDEFEAVLEEARSRAGRIVARMRSGEIRRDPGPRPGMKNHDVCPAYCTFAPVCRRDRPPVADEAWEPEEQQ